MATKQYTAFIEELKAENFKGFNVLEYADGGEELYISFKTLLRFISKYQNLFSEDNGENKEIIAIDWQEDKPMFMYSTTVSCNLQKCYVQNPYLGTSRGSLTTSNASSNNFAPFAAIDSFTTPELNKVKTDLRKAANVPDGVSIYPSIGNVNSIYLNTAYLLEVLIKESDNEDGEVSIRKYLQEICNGVNKALGSINDLQVTSDVDTDVATLTIIDYQQKRIRGLADALSKNKKTTEVKAQGLGSMLTSISIQSNITPEVATMISVGAQAQGHVLGEEAVSFSRLSRGLTDRIYPTKEISDKTRSAAAKNAADRQRRQEEEFQETLQAYSTLIRNQQPKTDGDMFGQIALLQTGRTDYENIATELYRSLLAQFTETGQTSTGFIPVKLNLSFHGLGGLKIYQKFKLSNDVLPLSYSGDYEFIMMGVSHEVNTSRWTTTLTSVISLVDIPVDTTHAFALPLDLSALGVVGGRTNPLYSTVGIKTNKVAVGGVETTLINGEVPDEYMRELNQTLFPYSKWKGSTLTSDGGRIRLLKPIMDNLERMLTAYTKDNPNTPMLINSAFRTYPDQVRVRNEWERKGKPENAAYPGTSNHGFGRAIDFADKGGAKLTPSMPQYKWIKANASTYGFTRIYSSTEGEAWEAWHWQDLTAQEIPGTAPAAAGSYAAAAAAGTTYFP